MLKKYIKKPVEIEAVKFEYTEECINLLKDWMQDSFKEYGKSRNAHAVGWLHVKTLEDGNVLSGIAKHVAFEGDYIIRGVRGEFYPCKPDIFEETYSEVI